MVLRPSGSRRSVLPAALGVDTQVEHKSYYRTVSARSWNTRATNKHNRENTLHEQLIKTRYVVPLRSKETRYR